MYKPISPPNPRFALLKTSHPVTPLYYSNLSYSFFPHCIWLSSLNEIFAAILTHMNIQISIPLLHSWNTLHSWLFFFSSVIKFQLIFRIQFKYHFHFKGLLTLSNRLHTSSSTRPCLCSILALHWSTSICWAITITTQDITVSMWYSI